MDALTSMYSPGAQRGQRDDQFGQVAERGVEQSADGVARLGRDGFSGVTQQRRQRHDGQHRQHEQQRMRFGFELLGDEHDGHEHQQPKQRIVANFLQEEFHWSSIGVFTLRCASGVQTRRQHRRRVGCRIDDHLIADRELVVRRDLKPVENFGAELVAQVVVRRPAPRAADADDVGLGDQFALPADAGGNHVLDAVDVSFADAVAEEGNQMLADVLVDAQIEAGIVRLAVALAGVAIPRGESVGALAPAFDRRREAEFEGAEEIEVFEERVEAGRRSSFPGRPESRWRCTTGR